MPLKGYQDLIAWQHGVSLVVELYSLTSRFPKDERFGIIAQIRRAAVSVPSNIAEGYGRRTRGEYRNQLSVARGSLNEVSTLLVISDRLAFASREEIERMAELVRAVAGLLWRLDRSLKQD